MADALLRAVRTPLNASDVYAALRMAWRIQVRTEPTRAQLLTMMAQVWLETGAGAASYGYNLGGIKYTRGCGHDYYQVQTHEVIAGKTVQLAQNFRSYASLDDAAEDYVALLRSTFASTWPAIEAADCTDYARRLAAAHYYTANEAQYAAGLRARYSQLDMQLPPDTEPDAIERMGQIAVDAEDDADPDPAA
jgi:hypothetical protein